MVAVIVARRSPSRINSAPGTGSLGRGSCVVVADWQAVHMDDETVGDAARELLDMRASRRVVPDLPPRLRPETLADAYAIQHRVVGALVARAGGRCIGYKVACTNEIAQAALQIDRPVFGRLMSQTTTPSAATLAADRFTHRVVEAEFAFRI